MSWKNLKRYYVYTYLDDNKIPYYVGMGCKKRVIQKHLYVKVPIFENIEIIDDLDQQTAWGKEIELIAFYGREDLGKGTLKNLTNGGPTQKSGWNHSEISKQKISKGNTGKVRSTEAKEKYKKPKSESHIKNIKNAVKSLWENPEYKEARLKKIKEKPFAHKGKSWSKARRDAQMKKQNKNNEVSK